MDQRSARAANGKIPAETGTVYRAPRRPAGAWPKPRLTGIGAGVVATVLTLAGGTLDALLLDGPGALFGVVFLCACALSALWVRPRDLPAAPIAAPIAFTITLAFTGDGGDGFLGRAMSVITGLALHAGWLYLGTAISAAVVAVRKVAALRAR